MNVGESSQRHSLGKDALPQVGAHSALGDDVDFALQQLLEILFQRYVVKQ